MPDRRGVELSINVLVVIILGLVLLGAGALIFTRLFWSVQDTLREVDDTTRARIHDEMLQLGERVLAAEVVKEAKPGSFAQFDIGVRNEIPDVVVGDYVEPRYFVMEVRFGGFLDRDGQPQELDCAHGVEECPVRWLRPPTTDDRRVARTLPIPSDDEAFFSFGAKVPPGIRFGRYDYTVRICQFSRSAGDPEPANCDGAAMADDYPPPVKVYVDVKSG